MDLTQTYPRSPKETLVGLVHIPRMIDKARAFNQNFLGEYIFPCPLDKMILEFLKIESEEFSQRVESEENLASWIFQKIAVRNEKEIQSLNHKILGKKPDTDEKQKNFIKLRDQIDCDRKDVETWVDLIDLEEGRL